MGFVLFIIPQSKKQELTNEINKFTNEFERIFLREKLKRKKMNLRGEGRWITTGDGRRTIKDRSDEDD